MASKKKKTKKAKKSKSRKQRQPKEKSKIEQLKEKQNQLYLRVVENKGIILKQTGITDEEFVDVVTKYGYEGLDTLEGFDVATPIFDQMVELFKLYDEVSNHIERLKVLESKMLIYDSKKMVQEMETKIQELDKEEAYYTETPDKEGIVKMKKKWYTEKEFWENRTLKLAKFLQEDPNNQQLKTQFEDAKMHLRELQKKRNWARMKNISPATAKYSQKFGKAIATIQDSIKEVTKPFADAGKDSFSKDDDKVGNQYEHFFDDPKSKKKDWSNFYD